MLEHSGGDAHVHWPDGTDATLAGAMALVLTNLALFFVALIVAVRWRRADFAVLVLCVTFMSVCYHMCRSGFECYTHYATHRFLDHVSVNTLSVYAFVEGIVRPELFTMTPHTMYAKAVNALAIANTRIALYFALACLVRVFAANNVDSVWVAVFSFAVPAALLAAVCVLTWTPVFRNNTLGWTGVALFAIGYIFYALLPETWYETVHSLWHLFSMLSVLLIFDAFQFVQPYPVFPCCCNGGRGSGGRRRSAATAPSQP